ncbi:hypothetical protein ACJX0J_003923 (mitochondrion) [Zea mays]
MQAYPYSLAEEFLIRSPFFNRLWIFFFSTFTAHSHIFTFILDVKDEIKAWHFKTYYAVPSFQGMALEFTNKLRYLGLPNQRKETLTLLACLTSTSRYPFPLAKKNRHDVERKAYQDEAVQGYYPDIDENEEDLVQKMMHALAFFYSFVKGEVRGGESKRMDRSASLGIRHQNYKTGVGVAVFLLVKKLK